MLEKIDQKYTFATRRDKSLITPCCNKKNTDYKFVNYEGYPTHYGYCHSCGVATLPSTLYRDELNNKYTWNEVTKSFDPVVLQLYDNNKQMCNTTRSTNSVRDEKIVKYVDFKVVEMCYSKQPENNLLKYLRKKNGNVPTERVKKMYYIGTNKDLGTVFWNINSSRKVQKAKISYYTKEGRRTKYFKVPYKNKEGYYSCLFGEHLINQKGNDKKPIVLVESEKTAIVCSIHLPKYLWLAYGGSNGLTTNKIEVLEGRNIILVPDMSENAVTIIKKKVKVFKDLGIDAQIWDMTEGMSDDQLKQEGWYNCDLEDVIRNYLLKRN
ncbi:DUF6371 domain-containing protein [Mangrovimonas aestuarii]|uniref:DUF6371 domain-containing protein n=1 Tax=Mangrovimonas aestuarii TaxID=3018443 RepID=UPI0023787783|nr:DUF6371 domain-containing protein [Mangrovimonas aestuarii]